MEKVITSEKIIILDFGSQYTQLIARRIRESGVYSEIHHETSLKKIKELISLKNKQTNITSKKTTI